MTIPKHADLSWRVEETCFNAFPPLKQVVCGNWLLRFAEGLSRRANSVNALRPEADKDDPAALIAMAEAAYPRQHLPAIFRVTSLLGSAFDEALAARGYSSEGGSCVIYGEIGAVAAALDPAVELSPRAGPDFLSAMAAFQRHSEEQRRIYRRIARSIAVPAMFAALRIDGRLAALAFGALHDGLLCYESVITAPSRRRQGFGRRVIAALAAWARDEGATGACLQVEATNAPARALYDGFGLRTELHRYHYRRAPAAGE